MNILKKLFLVKEIKSKAGELHFRRWRLLQTKIGALYIHQLFKSDEDAHCHDHPWSFVSILLSGGYMELDESNKVKFSYPGQILFKKAEKFHKIKLMTPTTTLVLTGPRKREWGYSVNGSWINSQDYRKAKNDGLYE